MAKEKTKKYIITQRGVCLKGTNLEEVGSTVSLTEAKATSLVGKVRLASDDVAPEGVEDLKKETATLQKQIKVLTDANSQLSEALELAAAETAKLTAELAKKK